jgi:hypothetical protein
MRKQCDNEKIHLESLADLHVFRTPEYEKVL